MRAAGVTVVKLGGSVAGTPALRAWCGALAGCGGGAVIVPGGGAFADTVRAEQRRLGFNDAAAHAMALLAMEQYGLALADGLPALAVAASDGAIAAALCEQRVPVWAPSAMVLAADIPATWDVTSDSLAAWLCGRLGAARLLLVKHGTFDAPVAARDLATRGVVDPAFPRYLAASGAQGFIAGPAAHAAAAAAIRAGGAPGAPIVMCDAPSKPLHLPA